MSYEELEITDFLTEIYLKERVCIKLDKEKFTKHGITFLIYSYVNEGYEGYGYAFMKSKKNWFFHDMGHCSCYEPFEEFDGRYKFETLKELKEFMDKERVWGIPEYIQMSEIMYQICLEQFGDENV